MCILAMVMKFTFQQESGLKSHFGFSRFRSNFLSIPGILTRVGTGITLAPDLREKATKAKANKEMRDEETRRFREIS